ncbi:MAG: hypothetical protein IVW55_14665 [Chloroflexi bacterium]|nr:hypothetical protein [Chloroflexota bacterium]
MQSANVEMAMELAIMIVALVMLDLLALAFGVESREGIEYDPQKLGLPR